MTRNFSDDDDDRSSDSGSSPYVVEDEFIPESHYIQQSEPEASTSTALAQTTGEATQSDGVGQAPSINRLWHGGTNEKGQVIWLNKAPDEGKDLNGTKESLGHAITLRYHPSSVPNQPTLQTIIVRNAELQKLLHTCEPSFKAQYSRKEKGLVFEAPFRKLMLSKNNIDRAMAEVPAHTTLDDATWLLAASLKEALDDKIAEYEEMIRTDEITFNMLFMLFPPESEKEREIYGTYQDEEVVALGKKWNYKQQMCTVTFEFDLKIRDWDGEQVHWRTLSRSIGCFSGRKKINSLEAYPLKYYPHDKAKLEDRLSKRGQKFIRLADQEPFMVMYESEALQQKGKNKLSERIMLDTVAYQRYHSGATRRPPSFRTSSEGPKSSAPTKPVSDLESQNKHLFRFCSPVLRAFTLDSKSWKIVKVDIINEKVEYDKDAWTKLSLRDDYKRLVNAFARAQLEGGEEFDDFIQGKGQGLLLLLSGQPGTGKTLTTESIAEEIERPLYSISADELGSDSGGVEQALNKAFDLAGRWQAVLLIDEADVFLGSRSSTHLTHNSIVAVFLRKLEYFRGLVFLTTNRHTSFDQAFRSRIHVHLRYSDLDQESRLKVWNNYLEKAKGTAQLGVDIGPDERLDLSSRSLNGREIRNVIKTALLLAWSVKQPLRMEHLTEVMGIEYDGSQSGAGIGEESLDVNGE